MSRARAFALISFAAALLAGWSLDVARPLGPQDPALLAVDFHVHAMPGDGSLPVWEIQREAARRGLDAVAITNHNHTFAVRIARRLKLLGGYPIVIDSQELTTPAFHMAAVGASQLVDWRLPAAEAIADIHRGGGIAIAAHPDSSSWLVAGGEAMRALDGTEVQHSSVLGAGSEAATELRAFYERAQRVHPEIAPIGASDFHWGGPVGVCRTYVAVEAVSQAGIVDGVRRGRTVAVCPGGRVTGAADLIERAGARLAAQPAATFGYGASTWIALTALLALAATVVTGQTR